jgi:hypothetical protein
MISAIIRYKSAHFFPLANQRECRNIFGIVRRKKNNRRTIKNYGKIGRIHEKTIKPFSQEQVTIITRLPVEHWILPN